jgi:hypothetical protein
MSGSLPLDADRRPTKRRDEDFQKAGRRSHRTLTLAPARADTGSDTVSDPAPALGLEVGPVPAGIPAAITKCRRRPCASDPKEGLGQWPGTC